MSSHLPSQGRVGKSAAADAISALDEEDRMATGREVAGGDEAGHASADNNCIVNVWHYVFGTSRWLVVQVIICFHD